MTSPSDLREQVMAGNYGTGPCVSAVLAVLEMCEHADQRRTPSLWVSAVRVGVSEALSRGKGRGGDAA